jgi:hypothetical protein
LLLATLCDLGIFEIVIRLIAIVGRSTGGHVSLCVVVGPEGDE